ncbi:hypothetical protein [Candidatus Ichthyocystis hellenicum]|uniref:hypothetical protein n=1 Tax=Candidatus Ichthyocystis hellenicum TaxID=1561003 RepID=UPI000B8234F3|nr:hypothetical protein [Candidatus Ichthyocystis hellenicum]
MDRMHFVHPELLQDDAGDSCIGSSIEDSAYSSCDLLSVVSFDIIQEENLGVHDRILEWCREEELAGSLRVVSQEGEYQNSHDVSSFFLLAFILFLTLFTVSLLMGLPYEHALALSALAPITCAINWNLSK